ncbi:MAG TPA: alcohol dehydrogenase catalytic domain-containing protein [Dehalococcoidia bacterium]|nr:alcohol dehydrogenase catalytic domain-containing protein [Dehalococcoidia bacterium]
MKAAVTTGKRREIVVRDIPKPVIQPGTLLMKTKYCSICGSDLEYLNGDFEWRGKCGELHADAILGHEFCAEVVEVGEGINSWVVGDRATTFGGMQPCGDCYYCRRGLHYLCYGGRPRQVFYNEHTPDGYGGKGGAFCEYFLARPGGLLKLPDSVSDEEGALVEPLNIGVSAIQAAGLKAGDSLAVIGAGKIGIGAMLAAKASGLSPVIITDLVESRLEKALEMGADAAFNPDKVDVISEVVKLTEEGPDGVIIAVREGNVLNQAIDMVRRGGIISLVGAVSPTEVNPRLWYMKHLRFVGTMRFAPILYSLNLIAHRQVNLKPLISAVMPLDDARKAFDSMYSGENIVVLLKP